MIIVAIDPATNSGFCRGVAGGKPSLLAQRFRVSDKDEHEDIFGRAVGFFKAYLEEHPPEVLAIERPIHKTFGETTVDTTAIARGLYGIFTGFARYHGIAVMPVASQTWRKSFLGNGSMTRQNAKAEALRRCKYLGWQVPERSAADAAEAAGIWHWACGELSPIGRAEAVA